jgi:hypothetical protein
MAIEDDIRLLIFLVCCALAMGVRRGGRRACGRE